MSKLIHLSKLIWKNTIEIKFGNETIWNPNSLKKKWFIKNNYTKFWPNQSSGWYWFICEINFNELQELKSPSNLPKKGCNFGALTRENLSIFSKDILCLPSNNELIIYNGHENSITRRIRTHFSLSNDRTGALGIIHYPLSTKKWKVKFFTNQQIQNLPLIDQKIITKLIQSKSGRNAIENAWRVYYGWPIFCKQ